MRGRPLCGLAALPLLILAGACDGPETARPAVAGPPVLTSPVAIIYLAGACFGTCQSYTVTVRNDGTGLFEGDANVALRGARRFAFPQDRFRALVAYLAPAKPAAGSSPEPLEHCYLDDAPTVTVTWVGADGARQSACLDRGGPSLSEVGVERITHVPRFLPIGDYIGTPH